MMRWKSCCARAARNSAPAPGFRTARRARKSPKAAYPDPKQDDSKLVVVDLEAGNPLKTPVTLKAIKADPAFADLALVRQGRLSVVPVPPLLWSRLLKMGA